MALWQANNNVLNFVTSKETTLTELRKVIELADIEQPNKLVSCVSMSPTPKATP